MVDLLECMLFYMIALQACLMKLEARPKKIFYNTCALCVRLTNSFFAATSQLRNRQFRKVIFFPEWLVPVPYSHRLWRLQADFSYQVVLPCIDEGFSELITRSISDGDNLLGLRMQPAVNQYFEQSVFSCRGEKPEWHNKTCCLG